MHPGLVLFCILFLSPVVQSQSAINLKAGLLNYEFKDENGRHHGQSIGLDAIVQDSRFLFMPGLHYQQYTVLGRTTRDGLIAQGDKIHQIHVPVNFGLRVLQDRVFTLRAFAGAHVSFLAGVDENTLGVTLDRVNEVQPGVQAGIQLMIWRITADVHYINDFRNVIPSHPYETKLRGWEFLIGIAL